AFRLDFRQALVGLSDLLLELRDLAIPDFGDLPVFARALEVIGLDAKRLDVLLRLLDGLNEILLLLPARTKLLSIVFEARDLLVDARQLLLAVVALHGFAFDLQRPNLP